MLKAKHRSLFGILCFCLCAASPAADSSPFGIASSSSGFKDIAEWFPRMKEIGVTTVRLFPEWSSIQPKRGDEFRWEATDALLKTAAANQLRINGILMGSIPGTKAKPHTFPMDDLPAWSEYVRKTVEHCKGSITHWEVWNEGNGGFNSGKHTTADYAKLAAATYAAAKQADPSVQIALTTASFDPAYLGRAILAQKAAGGPPQFDFLCIHPYELADNVGRPNGDVPFLWMTSMLRDVLKQHAPEKIGTDIWITEIGRNVAGRNAGPDAERTAAAALIKQYTMALAQCIRCIQWFEGRDPIGEEAGFGLLTRKGDPRRTFNAFRALTAALGKSPRYLGWLALNDARTLGFVFQGANEPVLVIWKDATASAQDVAVPSEIESAWPLEDKSTKIAAGAALKITDDPAFITKLPAAWLTQAESNRAKPFPWGGDYSSAKTVSLQLGAGAKPGGVFQSGAHTQPRITFPDGSTGILMSANQSSAYYVHPTFANIHTQEYHVRITVRRVTPGNVGMNLHYEVADSQGRAPYKNVGQWFRVSNSDSWQTHTWHVKDACLAKMWGHDLSFVPEQSQPFVIGKLEVSTEPFPAP